MENTNSTPPLRHPSSTQGQMGAWAPYYDLIVKLFALGREKAFRQASVDLAPVLPGNKVLEVGCGTGSLTLAAKARAGSSGEVHGLDAAPEMIAVARRKSLRAGREITFQVGSIDHLPYADGEFDVVLCSFMIFHMPEDVRRKGLQEIFRVLKTGGRMLVIESAPAELLNGLQDEMVQAGFTGITQGRMPYTLMFFVPLNFVRGLVQKA